ncbi:MAG: hypothetical protein K8R12_07230, partial [Desulfobacterales bacterium]|nr:hypothetical protein [Desulfobacterales bacterium]
SDKEIKYISRRSSRPQEARSIFVTFYLEVVNDSCTVVAANRNHINFYRNAQTFDRLRSVRNFRHQPAWTSFSEPLQIHFVSVLKQQACFKQGGL